MSDQPCTCVACSAAIMAEQAPWRAKIGVLLTALSAASGSAIDGNAEALSTDLTVLATFALTWATQLSEAAEAAGIDASEEMQRLLGRWPDSRRPT